jgi:hypothetical protein
MNDSSGTPGGSDLADRDTLRQIVGAALLQVPGGIDTQRSGGSEPSPRLSRFVEEGLRNLYLATANGASLQEWLCVALDVPDPAQLHAQGPLTLARRIKASAGVVQPERRVVPFTDQEETQEGLQSQQAREQFGAVPDQAK